jgi:DNA helicase-2/ATP-dependent DNA helicase PcrA
MSLRRVLDARPVGVGAKTIDNIVEQAQQRHLAPLDFLAHPDFLHLYDGRQNAKLQAFCGWCQRLQRIPMERADEAVKALLDLSGLVEQISTAKDDPAWEDRLENLEALMSRAAEFSRAHPDGTLAEFLEDVALVADIDNFDPHSESVTLTTLHSAKGLEFDAVFLVGLEDGILPHRRFSGADSFLATQARAEGKEDKAYAEERRLFYVGITRARKKVYISHTQMRFMRGEMNYEQPSPFLRELPSETLAAVAEKNQAEIRRSMHGDDDWFDEPLSE